MAWKRSTVRTRPGPPPLFNTYRPPSRPHTSSPSPTGVRGPRLTLTRSAVAQPRPAKRCAWKATDNRKYRCSYGGDQGNDTNLAVPRRRILQVASLPSRAEITFSRALSASISRCCCSIVLCSRCTSLSSRRLSSGPYWKYPLISRIRWLKLVVYAVTAPLAPAGTSAAFDTIVPSREFSVETRGCAPLPHNAR